MTTHPELWSEGRGHSVAARSTALRSRESRDPPKGNVRSLTGFVAHYLGGRPRL